MAKINPPMIATPIGILLVAAEPNANAMGKVPKEVARLVIKMGLNRDALALVMASNLD